MKILYIADYQSQALILRRHITTNVHDGANTKISRIARGLTARGHSVALVATGITARRTGRWFPGFDCFLDETPIPIRYGASIDVPVLNHLVGANCMRRWVRRNGPWDCVLMYNFAFEALTTCLDLCRIDRVPLVVEYEDDAKISLRGESRIQRQKGEWAISSLQGHIGGALVVTERLSSQLQTSNVLVLPGVVEDTPIRRACQPPSGRPIVVYCGGMNYLKGPDVLLNALQYVHQDLDLHFFGAGPMLEELRESARGVSRHSIKIHGRVTRALLTEYLNSASVFVNPHRMALGHSNSLFPFKVFEYLATGRPVVTSQINQMSSVIEGGLIRYREDSPQALAEALSHCLADYATYSRQAMLAAEEIQLQYSVSAVAERIEKVLKAA